MGKLKITCEEATMICTKTQYGESTFIERFKLRIHFMYCKVCRMFSKQNSELTDVCCSLAKKRKEDALKLTDSDKEQLKSNIQELKKEL